MAREVNKVTAELTDQQAWDLAQFFKRAGFSNFRNEAVNDDEAYRMQEAANVVYRALRESGYDPR